MLEKALKYVSTRTRNEFAETRPETDENCDTESDNTQSNTTSNDGIDDTTSAAGQLFINGE